MGATKENFIIYGLVAFNVAAQGIFADDLAVLDNVAFVNVLIHETASFKSQWKDVSTNHLLFWGVTLLDQEFAWRTTNIRNVSVKGCIWQKVAGNIPTAATFTGNHYIESDTLFAKTPGTNYTVGNPRFVDARQLIFVPAANSPLRNRLAPPPVPFDIAGRPRAPAATVGAIE
jgi:hypothetical protein